MQVQLQLTSLIQLAFTNPKEFGELISGVFKNVSNIDKAIVSVHCHNDLGMAVANSLSALENGGKAN
ncbi:MAG: hypothetical protein Ct9H90mP2_11390 [Dehalococcoidia bacterium]|nr:MAG: hypothetical protein Ct9H90mP2_11390 [Dehalococcoidia bacterium]